VVCEVVQQTVSAFLLCIKDAVRHLLVPANCRVTTSSAMPSHLLYQSLNGCPQLHDCADVIFILLNLFAVPEVATASICMSATVWYLLLKATAEFGALP
jgi:hypothetical protein